MPMLLSMLLEDEKALLKYEREGKEEISDVAIPLRLRNIHSVTMWYKRYLLPILRVEKCDL